MRKRKCKEKYMVSGNMECLIRRKYISGLRGCLCNEENCYLLKNK